MRPPAQRAWPTPGTHNAQLLGALLEAHPSSVWHPNSRLRLMAHSRASDLRRLGWPVHSVTRADPKTGNLQHGYVLKMTPQQIVAARRQAAVELADDDRRVAPDDLLPAAEVARRAGLTVNQLRHLARRGIVTPDEHDGRRGWYGTERANLLIAAGVLVALGVGLDRAVAMLRQHAADLEHAVAIATSSRGAA